MQSSANVVGLRQRLACPAARLDLRFVACGAALAAARSLTLRLIFAEPTGRLELPTGGLRTLTSPTLRHTLPFADVRVVAKCPVDLTAPAVSAPEYEIVCRLGCVESTLIECGPILHARAQRAFRSGRMAGNGGPEFG